MRRVNHHDENQFSISVMMRFSMLFLAALISTWFAGCSHRKANTTKFAHEPSCQPCQSMLQQIEYPDLKDDACEGDQNFLSPVPITISNFHQTEFWEMTVEQCVEMTLANSEILQKLGGTVVNAPQAVTTLFNQGIVETEQNSVEAALSAFDAQLNSGFIYNRNEREFNNIFQGGGEANVTTNSSNFNFELAKQAATGTRFAIRNLTTYNRTDPITGRFDGFFDTVQTLEVRQPLLRGFGSTVNRIAGPNAQPGVYNGVVIARIRSDISLADFEAAVRDLVQDVVNNYWELYFAYRNLDTDLAARDSARETWENRKLRYENGIGRPDEEAQARQQYFNFQGAAQDTLVGRPNGQLGLLGAERNLRRLMSLSPADGRIIKPITDPAIAPVIFDWEQAQQTALQRRVELRRQKWFVRQRELELLAARCLNKWQLDLVGQYGWRGFGDRLFGNVDRTVTTPNPNPPPDDIIVNFGEGAVNDLFNGDLNDWQVGVELGGAIGNRANFLAERNAELNLVREKAILREQERQIMYDLNAAYTEVDRAHEVLKTALNSRLAVQEELEPKQRRVIEGQDQVFFLLDAVVRAAAAERAAHRSIADYNQALLNFSFTTGSLLSRYNVTLSEGAWSDEAEENALEKAKRFRYSDRNKPRDIMPVSAGPYNQMAPREGVTLMEKRSTPSGPSETNGVPTEEPDANRDEQIPMDVPETPSDSNSPISNFDLGKSSQRESIPASTSTAKAYFQQFR